MMNAKEMAAITATAIAEETENRRNKAKEMLNVIAEEAEEEAKRCGYQIKINVGGDLDINWLMEQLSEREYDVKKNGYSLTISWFSQWMDIRMGK